MPARIFTIALVTVVSAFGASIGSAGAAAPVATFAGTGASAGAASASFNGRTSLVAIRHTAKLELSRAMTLEAWIWPSRKLKGRRDIVVKASRGGALPYGLELTGGAPDAYARMGRRLVRVSALSALPVRTWSFVVASYDGRRLRLFVNDRQAASEPGHGKLRASRGPLEVGGDSVWGRHFRGLIVAVRVYAQALSIRPPRGPQPPQTPPTPTAPAPGPVPVPVSSPIANLWVSTSGGTCARQASAGAEIPFQDCGSLNAAYAAARCGDIVNIDAGDYSGAVQDIQDPAGYGGGSPQDSCAGNPIVFEAAAGVPRSDVVFGTVEAGDLTDFNTNGASNWTLLGVTVTQSINVYPPATAVTINDVVGSALYINGVDGLAVENSMLGPCYSGAIPIGACSNNIKIDTGWKQGDGQTYTTTNVAFVHNTIHDFINNGNTHFECMFIVGGTNLDIDSNKFIRCQNYGIFLSNFRGTPFTNLVIQNNWFAETMDNAGSTQYAVDFGGTGSENNVLIRYNSFAPDEGVTADGAIPVGTNDWVIGNIGGNNYYTNSARGCIPGLNYAYNIWNGVACGTGDKVERILPYLSAATGAENFHLIPASGAQDFVTPNSAYYQLGYDMDGNARPATGPRDAGAEQQNG